MNVYLSVSVDDVSSYGPSGAIVLSALTWGAAFAGTPTGSISVPLDYIEGVTGLDAAASLEAVSALAAVGGSGVSLAGTVVTFSSAVPAGRHCATPQAPRRQPGYVYAMASNATTGPYKVGRAKNPKQRHRDIQAMNGDDLHLLRLWRSDEDYIAAERAMHATLAPHRGHGEWFRCSLEDIDRAASDVAGLVVAK